MMIPSRSAQRRTIALSALLAEALLSARRTSSVSCDPRSPRPSCVSQRCSRVPQAEQGLRERLPTARGRSGTPRLDRRERHERRERASERGARCADLSFEAISNTYLLDEKD